MRVTTSIKIDTEILAHSKINPNIKNLSDWINEIYFDKFMSVELEERKIKELEVELIKRKSNVDQMKSNLKINELPEHIINWIRQIALPRVKQGRDKTALLRLINHDYGLGINMRQFNYYLDLYKVKNDKE